MTDATLDTPKEYLTLDEVRRQLDARGWAYAVIDGVVVIDWRDKRAIRLVPAVVEDTTAVYRANALGFLMEQG